MSEEDRIELKKELSVCSKEELLEKYIDELEENCTLSDLWCKSQEKIKEVREYIEEKEKDDDNWIDYELCIEPIVIKEILEKENKE